MEAMPLTILLSLKLIFSNKGLSNSSIDLSLIIRSMEKSCITTIEELEGICIEFSNISGTKIIKYKIN
jgi:hypothetical protein